ncbi:MAG: alpha-glucosidase C-terminal domain-containing protein [Candidatus Krumholzibacteriota bacterium]|nr:alpha-glucosidase C-terminal domain-containing protein [Candidatus Krumholzibacteriota bacterium]
MGASASRKLLPVLLIVALLAIGLVAADASAAETRVTFTFRPDGRPGTVHLAGSFNGWSTSQDAMADLDGDGIWMITLALAPGQYQYKYVIDGGTWKEDPHAAASVDDGYGGKNSVVDVPDGAEELAVGIGEGGGGAAAESAPAAAPASASAGGAVPVRFVFEAAAGSNIYVAGSFNDWDPGRDRMADDDGDGVYEWRTELAPGRYEYKFVKDGSWLTDETAAEFADDGFGGKNSVLYVPVASPEGGVVAGAGGGSAAAPAAGGGEGLKQVTFSFQPVIGGVANVFLAGSFNDWNDSKTRMSDEDGDGVYETTLLLAPGTYQYKFVVDGTWLTDEAAADFADDGFGGRNSVIAVDASYEDVSIEEGDGEMMTGDLAIALDYSTVNPLSEEAIEFKARAHTGDVEHVQLLYAVDGGGEQIVDMLPEAEDVVYTYYRAVLDVPVSSTIRFAFDYVDGGVHFFAAAGGFASGKPAAGEMFVYSPETVPAFFTPDWAKNGVFYQIFPERFRNGDTSNDPDFTEPYYAGANTLPASGKTNGEYFHLVTQWENIGGLQRSPYRTDGKPDYYSFYGGDIAGVTEKLDYLRDLGVTIIYFNPLNQARSNHKYDPMDYLAIDPHFADDATFKTFVREAHARGIRVVVDMAFNHTGDWHFAFIDGREKGRESKYWNWYEWKRWPLPDGPIPNPLDYYDCWWGFGIHPNLNYDLSRPNAQENAITDIADAKPNEALVEYVLSVADRWLGEFDIDGFRLDVPNEVPFWFWRLFRERVDAVKPDAFLIGEIWGNAMPWLGPRCFHSTMNYKFFRDPALKFFGQGIGTAADLDRDLAPGRSVYPKQAVQVMMNLIDSHDTERFLTLAGNNDRRLMLAALFQMTYVGIPQIYYGDEVGLRGGKDPDCRRPFPWGWEESPKRTAIHDYYTAVTGLRHAYPALRTGAFHTALAEGKVYAYVREDEANRILVVLNNDPGAMEITVPVAELGFGDGDRFADELNGGAAYEVAGGDIAISLEGLTGAVLVQQ